MLCAFPLSFILKMKNEFYPTVSLPFKKKERKETKGALKRKERTRKKSRICLGSALSAEMV